MDSLKVKPAIGQVWKENKTNKKFKITSAVKECNTTIFYCRYFGAQKPYGRWGMGPAWFDGLSGYSFVK